MTATVATAFAFAPWYFFLTTFFTGCGIGGEYAAINSAIDELIPARVRGRVDLVINGTYWLGSAAGAAAHWSCLTRRTSRRNIGWRLAFGDRRRLRHFRPADSAQSFRRAHAGCSFTAATRKPSRSSARSKKKFSTKPANPLPGRTGSRSKSASARTISFREIARVAFKLYPRRAVLGLALFIGQAFLYNGVTFNLGHAAAAGSTECASGHGAAVLSILWALSNFAGPLVLGHLFDTVGRKPMITLSYLGSAVATVVLAALFVTRTGGVWVFIAVLAAAFFLASAGAQRGLLDCQRDLPDGDQGAGDRVLLCGGHRDRRYHRTVAVRSTDQFRSARAVVWSFLIGAVVMAIAGLVELWLGIAADNGRWRNWLCR